MTAPQFTAPTVPSTASDFATFGAVHLDVTDLARALGFWRDLIGLEQLGQDGEAVRLGAGEVLVRVRAAGVNKVDHFIAAGYL